MIRSTLSFLIAAAALGIAAIREPRPLPQRPPGERPVLMLLTALPLMFSEDFSLSGGSVALKSLERRYRVLPISVASRKRPLLFNKPSAS